MDKSLSYKVDVKVQPLQFETLHEAISRCNRYVMICGRCGRKWVSQSNKIPRMCYERGCFSKSMGVVYPVAGLIERGLRSTEPNLLMVNAKMYRVYRIMDMVRAYSEGVRIGKYRDDKNTVANMRSNQEVFELG